MLQQTLNKYYAYRFCLPAEEYLLWRCSECKTEFPEIDGKIMCNGHHIQDCPWCRKDSEPFKNGRGI